MSGNARKRMLLIGILGLLGLAGLIALLRVGPSGSPGRSGRAFEAVPVEVAPVERGEIELRRTFSGTVEAAAKFVVAPKVDGRIERLAVDIADRVSRGQVVAELDNDEYVQAVSQAAADLAVARANFTEARSALEIASRELSRVKTLLGRGVASEAQFDASQAGELAKRAQLEVAEAQVARAEAALETARIRLGYTRITADWTNGNDRRTVAERFVDEGQTVSANAPLLSIVELDPVIGVIYVTEKDYSWLQPNQMARLTTDAWPDRVFEGRIARISPVFRQATRQARVELAIDNPQHRLKPGMFIRASVVLDRVAEAVIVPEQAITRRNDRAGVFIINEAAETVIWRDIALGIRDGGRVQIKADDLSGRVVILGQQLLDDGSKVIIPEAPDPALQEAAVQ